MHFNVDYPVREEFALREIQSEVCTSILCEKLDIPRDTAILFTFVVLVNKVTNVNILHMTSSSINLSSYVRCTLPII